MYLGLLRMLFEYLRGRFGRALRETMQMVRESKEVESVYWERDIKEGGVDSTVVVTNPLNLYTRRSIKKGSFNLSAMNVNT